MSTMQELLATDSSTTELSWNGKPLSEVLVVASVPIFFDWFLGPHIAMLKDLDLAPTIMTNTKPERISIGTFVKAPFARSPKDVPALLRSLLALRREIAKRCTGDNALMIHLHTPLAATLGRIAVPAKYRDDVCVVYTAHGFHFLPGENTPFARIERVLAKRTDLLMTMNSDDTSSAESFTSEGRPKVVELPGIGCQRAVSSVSKKESNAEKQGPTIIAVGMLENNKRPQLAIQSFAASGVDGTLKFFGEGPLLAELQQLCIDEGVEDRVEFVGFVSDLRAAYAEADCMLFLSGREGLPMAVVEGVAAGLPVVAFDIRGVRDILRNLDDWFQPKSIDPADVAKAINEAVTCSPNVDQLTERASRFSVEASVKTHRSALLDLLGATGRNDP